MFSSDLLAFFHDMLSDIFPLKEEGNRFWHSLMGVFQCIYRFLQNKINVSQGHCKEVGHHICQATEEYNAISSMRLKLAKFFNGIALFRPPPPNVPLYLMQPLANKSTFIKLSLLTQQIVKKQCLQSQIISKKPKFQHHLTGHQQLKQSFTTSLKKENNKKRAIKFIYLYFRIHKTDIVHISVQWAEKISRKAPLCIHVHVTIHMKLINSRKTHLCICVHVTIHMKLITSRTTHLCIHVHVTIHMKLIICTGYS